MKGRTTKARRARNHRGSEKLRRAIRADSLHLERGDSVLWSLSPRGIILHELSYGKYLELDAIGYGVWGFLDGARPLREVVDLCLSRFGDKPAPTVRRQVRRIVNVLLEHGFIMERLDER